MKTAGPLRLRHRLAGTRHWPALLLWLVAAVCAHAGEVHLVVLHTNDVHGQALPRDATWTDVAGDVTGGVGRVAAYVRDVRAEHSGPGRAVLVLDGGDWWQGTPEGMVNEGRDFVRLLAAVGYDAMVIGNHEFDLGVAPLQRLLADVAPPAICANVRLARDADRVPWARPFRIVEFGELSIALVGLIATETPLITHEDARALHFADPAEELARVKQELPDGVDLIIPVNHCGLDSDRALARAHPDLRLIVGGHSHTYLREGERVGETLIVQAGDKATVVGRVDMWVDDVTGRVRDATARHVELFDLPPRPVAAVESAIDSLVASGAEAMSVVVGTIAAPPVRATPWTSSGLGNWMADCLREQTGAAIGIHNRGGIRKQLVAGAVTRRDLFEVMPFANTVVEIELTGAELQTALARALLPNLGVRVEVSGMSFEVRRHGEGLEPAGVRIGGTPLDPDAVYRVATNSFLATGGDGLFLVDRELPVRDTGILIREHLERVMRRDSPLVFPAEARFTLLREGP